jgi:hypothetical protein
VNGRPALPFAVALVLVGCATQPPGAGDPAVAALGGTAAVGPVRVMPVAVLEDSRCPQAIRCVWAGRVRLAARVNGEPAELTLGQPVPVAGGALLLAEVRPPRQPDAEIAPAAYRFRFSFSQGAGAGN